MNQRKYHRYNVYFWWKSKSTGRIQWCVKWKRKKYIVDKVQILGSCCTRNRKSNPHGVIEGMCEHISFIRIKKLQLKHITAIIK